MREKRGIAGVDDGMEFTKLKKSMYQVDIDGEDQVRPNIMHVQQTYQHLSQYQNGASFDIVSADGDTRRDGSARIGRE